MISLNKGSRFTLLQSASVSGHDLSFEVESFAVAPSLVAEAIKYYRENPQARSEIGTPAGLDRVQKMEVLPLPHRESLIAALS